MLAPKMMDWAAACLGDGFESVLAKSYAIFVMEANRAQFQYEKRGNYEFSRFKQVSQKTYHNEAFMLPYFWGVYVITFAWQHHLKIFRFFQKHYLPLLTASQGCQLDLGTGSGIWSFLALEHAPDWHGIGIDISATSINQAQKMAEAILISDRMAFLQADAQRFSLYKKADAAISCFLLEHLEQPQRLFDNLAANLKTRGYAFVTGVLTAAEIDHIYEFRRESELIEMAEKAGFRLVSMISAAPQSHPRHFYYLPRSMAMVLQKKENAIW